jgi:Family of unknown function (DUF5519)
MESLITWPKRDYRAWKDLGEGGIQHGVGGWCLVSTLRLIAKLGTLAPPAPPPGSMSALLDLPFRNQPRPRIAPHPIPHRELSGQCTPPLLDAIDELLHAEHARHAQHSLFAMSRYEKHFEGLYVPRTHDVGVSRTGEIVHVHRPQGSVHVQLSHADTAIVYERGWGELHPLSFLGFPVPRTWVLLYYPRDRDDVAVIRRIVSSAMDWACSL